jgi:hypothetical protein
MMKKLILTTLTVFAFSAQADFLGSSHDWNNGSSDPFKAALAAAESGYAANLKAKMAWRDTGKMIKEAKKLQASGNAAGAVALANKAHAQTVNAAAQTVGAGSAGPSF